MCQEDSSDQDSNLEELQQEVSAEDITVAIFCALSYETAAVKLSLDGELKCHPQGRQKYVYSYGIINGHKIVIAQPNQMGLVAAARLAATVSQQFPGLRVAMMVGIGAGIPNPPKQDIRLGDVAVSFPTDNHPGICQYDNGIYEGDGSFVLQGSLGKPPQILISAVTSLEQEEMMDTQPWAEILDAIAQTPRFARPQSSDLLFDEFFDHVNQGTGCEACEECAGENLIRRPERPSSLPVVHRGLILSGNGVIKNPEDRSLLRRGQEDAICYEMEAAGIMSEIPCLVVRGICDYADTHKQDQWHFYAAAVAAAYAKAILGRIDDAEVQAMEPF